MAEQICIFCTIVEGKTPSQMIKETNNVLVIKDISPKAPIHYLIIPKSHYSSLQEVPSAQSILFQDMFKIAQEIGQNAGDYRLVVNNGYQAGQRVFHLHMHFLAGKEFLSDI